MDELVKPQEPQEQAEMFQVDATKAKNLEELGIIFNALGIAMTKEYAKENNLEHMLKEG